MPSARLSPVGLGAIATQFLRCTFAALVGPFLRGAFTRQAVPEGILVLLSGNILLLAANCVTILLPQVRTVGHCTLTIVKCHEGAKLPLSHCIDAWRIEHGDIVSDHAGNVVVPRTKLHHLVVEIPHDARSTREVTVFRWVARVALGPVHEETHACCSAGLGAS